MRLQDRVVLVTGGGSGIGKSISLLFAKEGARVAVVGRRKDRLDAVVSEITKAGGKALALQADVSTLSDVQKAVASVVDVFGSLDILVNNAGVYIAHDALTLSEDEWNSVINIDLKGVWLCTKACIPEMLKKGKGKIINITSIAGLIGFEQSAAYCAAKGGVVNLTREMALDYAPKGILVNAIAPGVIETDMTSPMLSDEKSKQSFLEKTPVGRIGKPEDIAFAALFLASEESNFVAGQTIVVDGGWTIR